MGSNALRWSVIALLVFAFSFTQAEAAQFLRGDVDASGKLGVTDAVRILSFLFLGDGSAVACKDAADANDDGTLAVTDALFILTALFRDGIAPPAPFPFCGEDPSADELDCAEWKECPPVFEYFGFDFQAGAVFFVIDRSGTQQDSGELTRSKAQTVEAVKAFADGVQFGVFFADRGVVKFPASGLPADANPDLREAAVAFIQGTAGGGGSCDIPALLGAIQMANTSSPADRIIFYVGDGGGTCAATDEAVYLRKMLSEVTQANAGLAHIHTIATGPTVPLTRKHLEDLAAMNGGTFHEGF